MNVDLNALTARSFPFVNESGQDIPAFAVMTVTGTTVENGITFLKCAQTGTTFCPRYAVNGPQQVANGQRGTCFSSGEVRVLYQSGTPAAHEGWGARPGQWELARGFPGFTLRGIVHAGHRLARAAFEPVTQVLVKTTAAIAAMSNTTSYRIYAGSLGSESDAGFTAVPSARNRAGQSLASGEWAWLAWTNDGWELHAEHNRIHPVTTTSSVANGAALSVTLPDGRSISATNVSGMTLTAGSATAYQDFTTGDWYLTGARATEGGGGGSVEVTGFTIGGNLSGGSATATDDASATITVTDPRSEFRRALSAGGSISAANGVAIKNASDTWIVLECQSKAGWCVVILTEDMPEDNAPDANLARFGGTQQDIQRPVASSAIAVYDDDTLWGNALSGAKAIVVYDNPADKYRMVVSDQRAIVAIGTLGEDVAPEDAVTVDVTLDAALSPFPFGQQDDSVTEAFNAWGSKGKSGDPVLLVWSEQDQQYYFMRPGGGGPAMYKALLNGALQVGASSATIDTVTAFDGSTAPSPTTALNWLGKGGPDNAECWIMEDTSTGSTVYKLMDVKLVAVDVQTDMTDTGTALGKKRRQVGAYSGNTTETTTTVFNISECSG